MTARTPSATADTSADTFADTSISLYGSCGYRGYLWVVHAQERKGAAVYIVQDREKVGAVSAAQVERRERYPRRYPRWCPQVGARGPSRPSGPPSLDGCSATWGATDCGTRGAP